MQLRNNAIITSEQICAARHGLRWTFEDLATFSGISVRTLKTIEMKTGVPNCRKNTLDSIVAALEAAGIEFIGTAEDRPGIRIGRPK